MTISLPDKIAQKVDFEAKRQGFATRSEFVRSLLRKHFVEERNFELEEFEPVPLAELKADLKATGKYNEKFLNSVVKGFEKSSIYAK